MNSIMIFIDTLYYQQYTPQKRNSSPFHLQILKWPDGVQERSMSYTDQKKLLLNFLKFKLNKRGVSFFGECNDRLFIMKLNICMRLLFRVGYVISALVLGEEKVKSVGYNCPWSLLPTYFFSFYMI